ncbi:MAG: cold shock domain-containing protein [Ignavibacteria bacterium]|jgi:hypothetical protein
MADIKESKLDFCRVKKIFDKGFGFLSSLYSNEPVFFHFNNIKNEDAREKLNKMKRGAIILYYTSIIFKGKRRVYRVWLDVKDIDKELIPDFIETILLELNYGMYNVYDLAHALKELKNYNYITKEVFTKILNKHKVIKNPYIIKAILNDDDFQRFENFENLCDSVADGKIQKHEFDKEVLGKIFPG